MTGLTQCITEMAWADLLLFWYVVIDDTYQSLEARLGRWRRRGPAPRFGDSEVILVGLVCDVFFDGKEVVGLHFLRQYHRDLFPRLPSNGHFNERRTILGPLIEQVRQEISRRADLIDPDDPLRLIDSAPIPLCTYQRGGECQSYGAAHELHDFAGYSAKNNAHFMGYRLVVSVSREQMIDEWVLAPANYHDSVTMAALLEAAHDRCFVGDGSYHDPFLESLCRERRNTIVIAPPRRDSRSVTWSKEFRRNVGRLRRNIETVFSVLSCAFHLERPGSRSLRGLVCRISSQILAYTLCCLTTRQLQNSML